MDLLGTLVNGPEGIYIFETLENRLKNLRKYERPNLLLGVYKQLAKSHKGRKTNGIFRDFVENDSYNGHTFVWKVIEMLEQYGLNNHANRLAEQYSSVPQKKQKIWTELPNVVGGQNTVEELCASGQAGMELAGFGAIAAAFNRTREKDNTSVEDRFFYPTSRMFPFDETVYEIVKALEKHGFNVPGINVETYSYGPGDSYKHVGTIQGEDFRLCFNRVQGCIDGTWNDTAGVSQLNIPGKELQVFEDHSGPRLCVYVGKDWKTDSHRFVASIKVNGKLRKEPKIYLAYEGSWQREYGGIFYTGKIAPFLAHSNDEREYKPERKEPKYFETERIFEEFNNFLRLKVKEIQSYEK